MKQIIQFLKENPIFYLATVEGSVPRVRPLGFFMEFEGRLYFGVGDFKPVYRQLKENDQFEVSTTAQDKRWIRIRGKAVFDIRPEAQDAAFAVMPHLRERYTKVDGPRLSLFHVSQGEGIIEGFDGFREVIAIP